MNRRWLVPSALAGVVALLAIALPVYPGQAPVSLAMGVSGGVVGGVAALAFVLAPRPAGGGSADAFERQLRAAARAWRRKDRVALEGIVAEAVGPALVAHAMRVGTLCDLLAEQLALPPEETEDLTITAVLHVLPVRFGGNDDGEWPCAHSPWALAATASVISGAVCEEAGRMLAECRERWDGEGLPAALLREESCIGARVLAAVCAFDRASAAGLEEGLGLMRAGSASEFDPVVVGELLHLFRQPWPLQQAA